MVFKVIVVLSYVLLIPLLYWKLNENRLYARRSWNEQSLLLRRGLRHGFKETGKHWLFIIGGMAALQVAMAVVGFPESARDASVWEIAFHFCAFAFFVLLVVGTFASTWRTGAIVLAALEAPLQALPEEQPGHDTPS